jgi:hypothetical protein
MKFQLRNLLLTVLVCSMLASVAEARGRRKARKSGGAPATVNYHIQQQPNELQVPPPPAGTPPQPYPALGKSPYLRWSNGGAASQSIGSQVLKPVEPAQGGPVIYAVEPHAGGQNELLVRGDNFGTQTGQVMLEVNGVQLGLEATGWTSNAILVKAPNLQIASKASVHLTVTRADGVANPPTRLASQ